MKKYFVAGLVALLPLALTLWIVSFIIHLLTDPFRGLAETVLKALGMSPALLEFASMLLALVVLIIFIMVIGAIGRYFLFKYLIKISDAILHRIPIISTVYKTSQEFIQTVMTSSSQSFQQVVLVPFPHASCLSVGLVTRDDFEIAEKIPVFIPTTPNPTSGFLVMFRKEEMIPIEMKTEEALRYVLSCGVLLSPMQKENIAPFTYKKPPE